MPPAIRIPALPFAIALQGGGTHAAFAWGALDALLSRGIVPQAVSAVSAGAMNAVMLAEGLRLNGPEGAREHLERFWRKVSVAASLLPIRPHGFGKLLGDMGLDFSPGTVALDYITRLFSPYQFNLFDLNPLRGIVEEMIDFDALRADCPLALFIHATHARSGEGRSFAAQELSLDAVMASACLPYVFKTVEVDGEPYWDGAYSGHPPLTPLYEAAGCKEILLIETVPAGADDVPVKAADILDRANEISFNAVLEQEKLRLRERAPHVAFETLEARAVLAGLGRASKLNADWEFLLYLKDLGAQAARDWLGLPPEEMAA